MVLTVNGEERALPDGATVRILLAGLLGAGDAGLARGVAVAVSGTVIPRSQWDATELAPGAVVEVLTAVQGG
jgi:sulfur carrier protein